MSFNNIRYIARYIDDCQKVVLSAFVTSLLGITPHGTLYEIQFPYPA